MRIKSVLDLLKGRDQFWAEHFGDPLAARQPITVFTRHSATVFAHHIAHTLFDLTQQGDPARVLEAEDRPNMQKAYAGVAIILRLNAQLFHQGDNPPHIGR